ncbi:FCD domain-containing protein [Rhodococcus sp. IEGM 1366]|uniref:FadR/GntR family transcriptional regulator n=1 Tax=Rhodococcus sp. IEGM 1366 TaxID=3082223 RepID=UPI0029545FE1|nr:FCD domain-containing protein [Rhodococcus sp. IEGM 1366]MDV8070982.1 FCD domain-containing protein [Rhodococcus sp. IEGM 1366]
MQQLRQPRLAEIVAASLRDDILTGKLKEGDSLPRQEHLFAEYRVSLPAIREAMRILENEGLISVRRGNVGGAVVHLPSQDRTARMISMVLQVRETTLSDVSAALLHLEPICAGLCAGREDRVTEVVPRLTEALVRQEETFDELESWTPNARIFHEAMVDTCGNETMKVVIGSLEKIWSAHESTVWGEATQLSRHDTDPDSPNARKWRRAALKDHQKILDAIIKGDQDRAAALAATHMTASHASTLESSLTDRVSANLLDAVDLSSSR